MATGKDSRALHQPDETPTPPTPPGALASDRRITEADLADLRAGRLPLAEAAQWVARARGLGAPISMTAGPLAANGTGWLIAQGSVEQRLAPGARHNVLRTALVSAGTSVALSTVDQLSVRIALIVGLATTAATALAAIRARTRRRLTNVRRQALATGSAALFQRPEGQSARVAGTIIPQATFPALFRGTPSVLCRSVLAGADETRGIDFTVALDDGSPVRVEVHGGYVDERPTGVAGTPACGPVYPSVAAEGALPRILSALHIAPSLRHRRLARRPREVSTGPGDRVEVLGTLHREVAPDGVAAPGRSTPIRFVLRSSPELPLCVRRLVRTGEADSL